MKEYTVESIEEYISVIKENFPRFALSRGQFIDKKLLPSALRVDEEGMRIFSDKKTHLFFEDFKIDSVQYIAGNGVD